MNECNQKLLDIMVEFDCQTGTLHRAKGDLLYLVSSAGVPDFLMDKIEKIPFGKGIAGVAAQSANPVELCNLQQDLGGVAKENARKTGAAGSLAVPVFDKKEGGGRVIGTLGVGKVVPYDFSTEEKKRLSELGQEFAKQLISEDLNESLSH